MTTNLFEEKFLAARAAVRLVENGQSVGLGTGSTAELFVRELGRLTAEGLQITGIPTSNATAELATSLNIPLVSIDDIDEIDLTVDGTDEFDANLNLIKGGGGALFREKMVARLSKKEVIVADSSKMVERLGAYKVPLEVATIAVGFATRQIAKLGGTAAVRLKNGAPFITDAGNQILDADLGLIEDAVDLSEKLDAIEGVVCHGLFIGLATMVMMAKDGRVLQFERLDRQPD